MITFGDRNPRCFSNLIVALALSVIAVGITGCGTASNTYSPVIAKAGAAARAFSLSISPGDVAVVAGNSANYSITITDSGGFDSPVALTASSLPPGSTATFGTPTATENGSTVPLTVTTTNQDQSLLNAAIKSAVRSKGRAAASRITGTLNTTFTITGSAGGETETATAIISVTGAPDFMLAVSPSSVSVVQHSTANYTVTLTSLGGFDVSTVHLSITTDLPANTHVTFGNPTATATGETVPLSIATSTDDETPPGSTLFTVSGTGGSVTHTATATLVVTQQGED